MLFPLPTIKPGQIWCWKNSFGEDEYYFIVKLVPEEDRDKLVSEDYGGKGICATGLSLKTLSEHDCWWRNNSLLYRWQLIADV